MIKIALLIINVLLTTTCLSDSYSDESDKWKIELYETLLEYDSIEIKSIAVSKLGLIDNYDISNELEELLKNNLSKKAYFIIYSTCAYNDYKSLCEKHHFFENLKKIDPNNMVSYLNNLENAKNQEQKNNILALMGNSSRADNNFGTGIKLLKSTILEYNSTNNKIQNEIIHEELSDIFSKKPQEFDLEFFYLFRDPTESEDYRQFYTNSLIEQVVNLESIELMMYYYYFPNFNKLENTCKINFYFENCLKISEILINNSDIPTSIFLGYRIQTFIYNENKDFKKYKESIINYIKLKKVRKCDRDNSHFILPQVYYNTIIDNIENLGQNKAEKLANKALKEYNKKIKIENRKSDCSNISKLSNEEFFNIYSSDQDLLKKLEEF